MAEKTEALSAQHTTGAFVAEDGVELFAQEWTIDSPKAVVAIIHGYGEHSSRYPHVAERLNGAGYAVYAYDHRGHGQSPGRMGHIPSFARLVDDLDAFLSRVRRQAGDAPLFLFGHSMGGLVLAAYTIRFKPEARGLIFSAAGIKADENVSLFLRKISGLVAAVLPHVAVHELDVTALSRIEEVVERYQADALVYHGKIGARTGHEMMKTMTFVQKHLGEITLPVLVLHGTADRLVSSSASQFLHEHARSADKTLKLYDGAYHEVFNDLDAKPFLDQVVAWIDARA